MMHPPPPDKEGHPPPVRTCPRGASTWRNPHFCEAAGSEICLHWALGIMGHLVK
jgi:hypothetical protein